MTGVVMIARVCWGLRLEVGVAPDGTWGLNAQGSLEAVAWLDQAVASQPLAFKHWVVGQVQ